MRRSRTRCGVVPRSPPTTWLARLRAPKDCSWAIRAAPRSGLCTGWPRRFAREWSSPSSRIPEIATYRPGCTDRPLPGFAGPPHEWGGQVKILREAMEAIRAHGAEGYPHEICGITVGPRGERPVTEAKRVRNIIVQRARDPYEIDPHDHIRIQREADAAHLHHLRYYPNPPAH